MSRLPILIRIATVLLLFALIGTCKMLTGCTTIHKVFSKHTAKVDSTVNTRTDSLAYHQKVIKEGYGLSVRFDTGCTNRITFNPSTGLIEASGNVTGANYQAEKTEAQTDSIRLIRERQDRYIKETVTKTVTKDKKPKYSFWFGFILGVSITMIWHNRKTVARLLNPLSRFYPF